MAGSVGHLGQSYDGDRLHNSPIPERGSLILAIGAQLEYIKPVVLAPYNVYEKGSTASEAVHSGALYFE
jgi:pyruvate/2-oxoglutarate/acetoin dehydrogenase E1 component